MIIIARKPNQSKKAGFTKRIESEKSMLGTTYKFDIGDKVKYLGGMFENYKHQIGIITNRSSKGHRIDYSVKFLDGVEKKYIIEKVLELYVENNNESEVISNEN